MSLDCKGHRVRAIIELQQKVAGGALRRTRRSRLALQGGTTLLVELGAASAVVSEIAASTPHVAEHSHHAQLRATTHRPGTCCT